MNMVRESEFFKKFDDAEKMGWDVSYEAMSISDALANFFNPYDNEYACTEFNEKFACICRGYCATHNGRTAGRFSVHTVNDLWDVECDEYGLEEFIDWLKNDYFRTQIFFYYDTFVNNKPVKKSRKH